MTDAEQRPVFEATVEVATFEKFLETFYTRAGLGSELIKELIVEVDEDGIWSRAVEAANHVLVEARLHADAFEHIDGEGARFGVSIEKLLQFLGPADKSDLVELTLDAETRKLELHYEGTQLSAACIDPDAIRDRQDIPDLDHPNEIEVSAETLEHAATLGDMVSDAVSLTTDPMDDQLIATASGDVDDVRHAVDVEGISAEATSIFNVGYMLAVSDPMSDDTTVTVELGDEFPILLHYKEADGNLDVTSMVAPRIQAN